MLLCGGNGYFATHGNPVSTLLKNPLPCPSPSISPQVTKINFFKNYLVRKTYSLWRDNIRYNLYCQQRKKLLSKLFLGKTSFCKPLLDVQNIMIEVGNVGLLDLQDKKVYESLNFIECQQQKRVEASKHFESFMETLQILLQGVCKDVENLGHSENAFDALRRGREAPGAIKKNKSMVSIRLELAAQKDMVKRAEQEARMVADFIRLVDYVCVETLVSLALSTHANFLSELLNHRKVALSIAAGHLCVPPLPHIFLSLTLHNPVSYSTRPGCSKRPCCLHQTKKRHSLRQQPTSKK